MGLPAPPVPRAVPHRIRIELGGRVVAETTGAYRPPRRAIRRTTTCLPATSSRARLARTHHRSLCEWKGQAHYFDVQAGERAEPDSAWGYDRPSAASRPSPATSCSMPAAWTRAGSTTSSSSPSPGGFYGGWITAELAGPFKGIPGSQGW